VQLVEHLRCGWCGTSREVVVADAAAQRYDADLDRGTREIAATLRRLEHERMAEEADAFATALRLDLLGAGTSPR
jgi:phosphoserine phosphatase